MKIPSSSSLLFATLAISSSSTSLAAPASDGAHSEGVSDARHSALSARRGSTSVPAMLVDRNDARSVHESRQLGPVIVALDGLPLVGPILEPLLKPLAPMAGAASVPEVARRDQLNVTNDVPGSLGNTAQLLPVPFPVSSLPVAAPSLPTPPVSLPGPLAGLLRRFKADEVAYSSSADASYTSTTADASVTQGSMDAAAFPVPLINNPATPIVTPIVGPLIPGIISHIPALPVAPTAVLPGPLASVPASLPVNGKRSEAEEVATSSSVDASHTSTATSQPLPATQGSIDAAALTLPLPINPVIPNVGSLIPVTIPSLPVNPLAPGFPVPTLPVNLPVPNPST